MGGGTRCELCGGAAAVHCAADAAFLCLRCDARVHGANFLASRHLRRRIGAAGGSGSQEASESASASAASGGSCVSTADSAESTAAAAPKKAAASAEAARRGLGRKRRARAEVVIEGWAKRMGFPAAAARRRASAAACALRALARGVAAARVPLRVAMAAALWKEIAATPAACGGEAPLLRQLEATAHVPTRLVLTVATWMARAATRPSSEDAEEGWAECS